jgi:hypothetical protein
MDGSADRIGDFVRGQDRVRLEGVADASGQLVDSFGDLDTNGDGVLKAGDANVAVSSKPELTLTLEGGSSIVFNNVAQLNEADFAFLLAV